MFCSNCGKEINDNARFCKYCGDILISEEKSNDNLIPITPQNNKEQFNTVFNRDVLNNYLFNVRTLEVARNKLWWKISDMQNRINSLGNEHYVAKHSYDLETPLYGIGIMAFFFIVALLVNWLINEDGLFSLFDFLQPIVTFVLFASVILTIVCLIRIAYEIVEDSKRYSNEIKYENKRIKTELSEKQDLSEILPKVQEEFQHIEDLLNEAYAINIIPSKFRNIYAVYFLYDFISTSTATLKEALFHCDLDTIQQKLDTVISQQQDIIMELAHSNALNEQIVLKNDEMLKHAIRTENNTALAAQYSQIAAHNTNVITAIQMSQYLKK